MAVTETPGYRLVKGSMLYFLYCAAPSAADPPVGRPYQRVRGPATFPDPPDADVPVDESDEQAASAAVTAVAPARPRKPRRLNAAPEVERFFVRTPSSWCRWCRWCLLWLCGFAHDQPVRQSHFSEAPRVLTGHPGEQELAGRPADVPHGVLHGREPRSDQGGGVDVVEPDDRERVRHGDAALDREAEGADRDQVVGAEHRRRGVRQVEQLRQTSCTAVAGERCRHDEVLVEAAPGGPDGVAEAVEPALRRPDVERSGDEPDPPVALTQQVVRRQVHADLVVAGDPVRV